ncbi:MAG TPA: hypothetical protein VHB25_01610 [Gemmatimonadaceae bacterium]|nr:hypothetical protein [Gemmatimonadaceae bacterium]
MYATCLFCNKDLGRNETFETFPVGKRLAFDAAHGRLWVVCPHCERWNLSPLEERWEAIEHGERAYRETRTRVATDNIGLAKLRDGTTIVRIGAPLRPEFAAWRYGDQFGRRRRKQILIAGGGIAVVGGIAAAGVVAGVGIGAFGVMWVRQARMAVRGIPDAVVAKIRTEQRTYIVRRKHLAETTLDRASDGTLALELRHEHSSKRFEGREAERVASILLPKVNRFGASRVGVTDAVREIESVGSAAAYVDRLSRLARTYTRKDPYAQSDGFFLRRRSGSYGDYGLFGLPPAHRLALEMSLHEESERRALEGELAELERAWRDAEEIAKISDALLVPPTVDAALDRMRGE